MYTLYAVLIVEDFQSLLMSAVTVISNNSNLL